VALMGQVERAAAGAGVPLEAYLELARGALENVAAVGPAAALTGPVARGDDATLARHLAALDVTEREAYEAMVAQARRLLATAVTPAMYQREKVAGVAGVVVVDRIARLRKELDAARARGESVGLVPTMGYLHDGHAALIRQARAECDVVVVTDFVNPLQFGEPADLESYPRDLDHDAAVATGAGADFLFAPSVDEMYPERVQTTVRVAGVSEGLEGVSRPGHFDGVATVVAKLFAVAGPCRAYFGEKDFQQLAVVRRVVADLSLPVDVVGCATVREPDGLAMSSRNVRLSPDERRAATVLHRALAAGAAALEAGERDPSVIAAVMAAAIACEPLARLDYAEAVDANDLSVPDRLSGDVRLLVAARVGTTRLIDNMGVTI
ncbi:MAG: pantoate--beta-alanine ligase, partial [Actinobacteria bacterium]